MAMPWSLALYMVNMVWMFMSGWISSCLTIANEIARSVRTGDIGPFHVG
ncbi:uncharacterized protein LOC131250738 [Magnolia sinica]|nr:uncharacterized protein LOC131250738 [Magnolia sinica]XP_058106999.1 uncharacterized protein LOC131250738 [Magnolia sinica]